MHDTKQVMFTKQGATKISHIVSVLMLVSRRTFETSRFWTKLGRFWSHLGLKARLLEVLILSRAQTFLGKSRSCHSRSSSRTQSQMSRSRLKSWKILGKPWSWSLSRSQLNSD